MVGASLDESISVPCRVNADPPDVEFEWSFSSSGERFEVPHGHYTTVQDINVVGTDGSKSSSIFYDSEETHGESDGKYSIISNLCVYFATHSNFHILIKILSSIFFGFVWIMVSVFNLYAFSINKLCQSIDKSTRATVKNYVFFTCDQFAYLHESIDVAYSQHFLLLQIEINTTNTLCHIANIHVNTK